MNTHLTALTFLASLQAGIFIGLRIRRRVPVEHLNTESKDVIKLSLGLIATMSAMLLGLLVSSSKSSYDTNRAHLLQMAAKVSSLDRVLANYGPDAVEIREELRRLVAEVAHRMQSEGESKEKLTPDTRMGPGVFAAIQRLPVRDEAQQAFKSRASSLAMELGELRLLVMVQATPSVPGTLLVVMASWFIVIFIGYCSLTPANATVVLSMVLSALAVSVAVFLILEFDRPFEGIIRLSSQPLLDALGQTVQVSV